MSRLKRSIWVALPLVLALFAGTGVLWAQSDRGTITGTVTDPSGAVISGATVTATQVATGLKTSTVSGAGGNFTIPLLQIGSYRVSATQTGFKGFVQEGVVLDVGQTAVVSITMQLGNITQTVQVNGEAPQLQTTTTTLSTAATALEVEALPLFGQTEMRNPAFFMVLDSSTSGRGVSNNGQGIFSVRNLTTTVAGSQSASTEFDVDGSRLVVVSFLSSAYNMIGFPQDAVQEFTLTTIAPPAEMGRSGGGVTSFTLKSGTNRFHGTGFEYLRNDVLDANGFFPNAQPAGCDSSGHAVPAGTLGVKACRSFLQQNEFGGTFGGPILKNKLFFFGWYDGFRVKQAAPPSLNTTPTAAMREGNFSAFAAPVYDPNTNAADGKGGVTRTQFQGNMIDPGRFDAVAKNMLPYFPNPTNSNLTGNYLAAGANGDTINEEGIKIDYELNSRNKLTGDYSYSGNSTVVGAANPYPPPLDESGPSITTTPEFRLGYDLILAPNIVNHIQYGFNRFVQVGELLDNIPGGWPAKLGYKGVGGSGAFPILNFTSLLPQSGGGGGSIPNGGTQNGTVIDESLNWVKGKHSLKFGVEYIRGGYNTLSTGRDTGFLNLSAAETGLPDMTNVTTGNSFASFLLGQVDSGQVYVYNAEDYERSGYYAGYAQDDFKVTPKLTLNLGVRYDLYLPTVMAHNSMSWMNPSVANPNAGGLPGVYQFASGSMRTPLTAYKGGFAPRVGLAYRIDNKTVIRVSYSMIYGPGGYVRGNGDCCSDDFLGGYNDINTLTNSNNGATPAFILANGWPASQFNNTISHSPGFDIGGYAERLDKQDARPLYVENRAFQIQRELGFNTLLSVGYVGNTGVHLPSRILPANEMPPQYLSYGNLLSDPIGTPAVQALAPVAAFPVDTATGNHSPFSGFEAAFGSGATLGQSLRIFPQYSSLKRLYESAGTSTYNSLQVKVDKRFSNGLNFLISYTWSKTLTNAGSQFSEFSGFDQNSFNAHNQKAVSLNDYPSNLVISYSYELPIGNGKHFLNQGGAVNKIVGGWRISGIQQYQSGAPQEIYEGNTLGALEGNNDNGNSFTRPNYNGGPILTTAARSGHFDPNASSMLNASAFSLSAPFTFGNGQQVYSNARRFPYLDEDISLSKKTYVGEHFNVEIRADFLNIFNRTVFGLGTGGDMYGSVLFNNTVGSASFGQISSQSNTPREIQFGLKINY